MWFWESNMRNAKQQRRKVAVITGTRAEYGLLSCLMKSIQSDPDLELQIIVTAMHLSPEFGLTYKLIEEDGFEIAAKVEMLLSSDSSTGTLKSMGLGMIGFADAFDRLSPELVVVLGDRFETLAVAQCALVKKIPLAHVHGGELSLGAIDDAIRHSITKMSHLHFVAADAYKQRVIQLGENPENVFNYGAPGLERIAKLKLLNKNELEEKINFQFGKQNFLVTYHPSTIDVEENSRALKGLFEALDHFPEAKIIFTKANADEMGRLVNAKIDQYIARNSGRATAYTTLGDLNYLSALQLVDAVIGNSSSGLIEVPYFQKATINLGKRQECRLRATSVIDCPEVSAESIIDALNKASTKEFKRLLKTTISPYTKDATSEKIKEKIKSVDLNAIVKKHFYDIQMQETLAYEQ